MKKLLLIIIGVTVISCEKPEFERPSYIPDDFESWTTYDYDTTVHQYFPPFKRDSEFFYTNNINSDTTRIRIHTSRYITNITFSNGYKDKLYDAIYQFETGPGYIIEVKPEFDSQDSLYTKVTFIDSPSELEVKYKEGQYSMPIGEASILDSVEVSGTTYYNVLEIAYNDFRFKKMWYAKDKGMIYFKTFAGGSFYLINSNTTQFF